MYKIVSVDVNLGNRYAYKNVASYNYYIFLSHIMNWKKSALCYNKEWNPFWSSSLIFMHICFDKIFFEIEEMHNDADSWIDKKC